MTLPEFPNQVPPPPSTADVPPAILAGGRKSGLGLAPVVVPIRTPPDAARKAVLEGAEKVRHAGEDVPETFWETILPWK